MARSFSTAAAPASLPISGTLQAAGVDAGTTGGTVKVLGEYVGLFDGTRIDASGDAGGGTVLIGGNFQGKGPEQNASRTYVGRDASDHCRCADNGDGGKVIVWSDDATGVLRHDHRARRRASGNGGFVEVSGKQTLVFRGTADLSAAKGSKGTLLLDPATLTITDGAGAGDHDASLPDILALGDADIAGNTVSEVALESLGDTADVILEATGQNRVSDLTDGVLDMAQTSAGSFGMTSTTSGGITFVDATNTIQTAGASITLQALGTGSLSNIGNLTSNGGAITLQAATSVTVLEPSIPTARRERRQAPSTSPQAGTATLGTINALGGAAASPGQNGGAVTLNAGTNPLAVGGINASGSDAVGVGDGGNAGAISLTGSAITLTSNLTAKGGNADADGNGGSGGAVAVNGPALLKRQHHRRRHARRYRRGRRR